MEATRELAPETWSEYLDAVSKELLNADVSIEVITRSERSMVAASHLALQGLGYDRRGDVFEVSVARGGPHLPTTVHHLVDHPERIIVDSWTLLAPMMIAVDGSDGARTVVRISRDADFAG